jgi:hypothetical protein
VVVDGPMGEMEGVADGRSESGIQRQFESPGSSATGASEWIWPLSWPVWIGRCLTGLEWECATFSRNSPCHGLCLFLCSLLQSTDGTMLEEGKRRAGSGWYDSLPGRLENEGCQGEITLVYKYAWISENLCSGRDLAGVCRDELSEVPLLIGRHYL